MNFLALLSNLAGPDMIIILLIVLVLFGAKRLPELAKGMGQAMKEFQKAKNEFTDEIHSASGAPAPFTPQPAPNSVPRLASAPPTPVAEPAPAAQDTPVERV